MFRSKIVKGLIMGLGLAMALSTAAFAEKAPDEEFTIQIMNVGNEIEAIAPDAAVSSEGQMVMPADRDAAAVSGLAGAGANGSSGAAEPAMAADAVSKEMYDKQLEADRYLFADHTDEIAAQGISVTHTVATNEYVEIGITPFSEENAEFIYKALGRNQIKVVEGIQAVTMDIGLAADSGEVYTAELYNEEVKTVSAPVDDQIVSITANPVSSPADSMKSTTVMAVIAVAAALLGGALLITRRMKAAKS